MFLPHYCQAFTTSKEVPANIREESMFYSSNSHGLILYIVGGGGEENLSIMFQIRQPIYSVLLQRSTQYLAVTEGNVAQYKEL